MERRHILALLACCLLPAPSAPAAGQETDKALETSRRVVQLIRRIEGAYRDRGPFSVDFVQRYVSSTFGAEEEDRGTILAAPPRRMLIRYTEPAGQRAVFDGDAWWLFDPEERTVTRREQAEEQADPLLELFSGRSDLLRVFAVRIGAELNGEKLVRLELLPRTPGDEIELLVLDADPESGELRRVEVVDPLGGQMVYSLGPPQPIDALTPAELDTKVPEGYLLVEG